MNIDSQKHSGAKPLIIGSIFAPSDLNSQWYAMQKRFIKKTTSGEYVYKIILNGVKPELFEKDDILLVNEENKGHAYALEQLLDYFRKNRYGAYLILDSDCFPVCDGWHEILIEQMNEFNKIIAAAVRAENLDTFPHPSVFFIRDEGIHHPRLNFSLHKTINLLGDEVADVGGAMQKMSAEILPMLRTNIVNLHPVAAAIYHHLFYHHGAGSRDFNFRILKRYDYYRHWLASDNKEEQCSTLLKELFRDPDKFIDKLMHIENMNKMWLSFRLPVLKK